MSFAKTLAKLVLLPVAERKLGTGIYEHCALSAITGETANTSQACELAKERLELGFTTRYDITCEAVQLFLANDLSEGSETEAKRYQRVRRWTARQVIAEPIRPGSYARALALVCNLPPSKRKFGRGALMGKCPCALGRIVGPSAYTDSLKALGLTDRFIYEINDHERLANVTPAQRYRAVRAELARRVLAETPTAPSAS